MSGTRRRARNKLQKQARDSAREDVSRGGKELSGRPGPEIRLLVVLLVLVVTAVLAAHWPVLSTRTLSFDDEHYLTENLLVQNPSWSSVRRFLVEVLEPSTVKGYYQPLAMISLMVDYAMGGRADNLAVFHRTSLALHAMNTVLVIVFLYMLFGRVWAAAIAGLLFGVHPLTVESIPWVAERKTLLATFLALWCLIFFVRYARGGGWKMYGCSAVMYVLSLMTKPTSIPLPILMVLLEYWPLRRLSKKTILEKIPLFAIGAIFGLVIFISQRRTFGVRMPEAYGPTGVVLVVCHNIVLYLSNMAWPANLSLYYPFPQPMDLSNPKVLGGVVGTCVLIASLVISLRWTRAIVTGWLFFFVAILPAMGIIGFQDCIAADRHAYLPFVGIILVVAYFLGRFLDGAASLSARRLRQVGTLAVVVVLAGLEAFSTRGHLVYWKDAPTHRRRMLALAPNEQVTHNSMGVVLSEQGEFDEAIMHYREVLRIKPDSAEVHNNLGIALAAQSKFDEATSHYRQALQFKSDSVEAHYNLANVLKSQGKLNEAIQHYLWALQFKPNDVDIHINLGNALQSQGRIEEAVGYYHRALQLDGESAEANYNIGVVLQSQGRIEEAISYYRRVLAVRPNDVKTHYNIANALRLQDRLDEAISHYRQALQGQPNDARVYNNLGGVLSAQGKSDEAISYYRRALQINPDDALVHSNLGRGLKVVGRFDEAIKHLREAVRLGPDYVTALNEVAWILSTHANPNLRDADEAIEFAERAAKLTKYQSAHTLDILAAAYASAGQFDKAVLTAQAAIASASSAQDAELAKDIRRRLELYEQRQPYREPM